ncbi:MAG: lamin tail domain-containing protein [Candidatus Peribacteraceae bacterium]|nr:lamin tail domain-containing protein [Candidatus Peribacteraceae bacterium]
MPPSSLRHRLIAYVLPASVLLCTLSGLGTCAVLAGTDGAAVISEVLWMGSDLSASDEWVEIACTGTADCDLSGWWLTSLKSTGEEGTIIVFAEGSVIAAGEVGIVGNFTAASSRLAEEPWIQTSAMSLPNTKLLLRLRDASGMVRDEVDDGTGNPFAGANPSGGTKASMERIDLAAPGTLASNWRTATESIGFDPGPEIFGTPGSISMPQASSSETSSTSQTSSTSTTSSPESSSSSQESIPLSSSSESSSSDSSSSSQSSLASLSSFSSLFSQTSSTSESSVSSSESSPSSSSESSSSEVSSTSSASGSSLSSSAASSTSFVSVSSDSSASSDSSETSSASQASSTSPISVLITEVLANPIGTDTDEWIEIGNLGTEAVDIAGWKLDDGNSSAIYTIPPRSGSGFFLAPGEHIAFRKSATGLPLDNTGERVSLMDGDILIDAWTYPETAEEVSYGRDIASPTQFRAFCVPTPDRPNAVLPFAPRIIVQSASNAAVGASAVTGTDHISLNLTAEAGGGSLASSTCLFDFGDDTVIQSCNPSSHTFDEPGTYTVRLTVNDFCGGISVRTLAVTVVPEPEETEASSVSSRSSSSSSRVSSSSSKSSSVSSTSSSSSVTLMSMAVPVSFDRGVIISEVQPLGTEWIEFFNPTDHDISLTGWTLDDVRDGGPAPRSSARSGGGSKPWTFPAEDGIVIGAGEYLVLPMSVTGIKLNDDGDDVWLVAPDGSSSEQVIVPKVKAGTSFSLVDGAWCVSVPTPGAENSCFLPQLQTSLTPSLSRSAGEGGAEAPGEGGKRLLKVKYVADLPEAETESGISLADFPEGLQSLVVTGGTIEPVEPEERPSRLPELLLFSGGLMASIGMVGRARLRSAGARRENGKGKA